RAALKSRRPVASEDDGPPSSTACSDSGSRDGLRPNPDLLPVEGGEGRGVARGQIEAQDELDAFGEVARRREAEGAGMVPVGIFVEQQQAPSAETIFAVGVSDDSARI